MSGNLHKFLLVPVMIFLALCGNAVQHRPLSAATQDDFRPLLNGHDLSGWVLVNTPAETWSFQDGMLICTGRPIGEIRTNKMFQNFILELEWRHMVPKGNAGIFVWADDITARGVPFHRSIEVQVLENAYGQSQHHTTHGDIFPIHGATMTPVNGRGGSRAFPTEERSKPSPEWNHYRIECIDGRISLAVNGKVVTQGTECSPRKGYICIESEGGVVHYRNMRIKELPDSPIEPEHVAIADRGYHSLYTGLDLSGWSATESGKGHWHVRDWMLHYDGKANTAADAVLTCSHNGLKNGFLLDVRPGEGFKELVLCGHQIVSPLKPGQWHRLTGHVGDDGKLQLQVDGQDARVNGQPATITDQMPLSIAPVGAMDFANIYLKSADKK